MRKKLPAILVCCWGLSGQTPASKPVLVLAPNSAAEAAAAEARWRPAAQARGWSVIVHSLKPEIAVSDAAIKAMEDALKAAGAAPEATYLVGEGMGASAVFYLAARRPNLWAAAVALGGSPRPAIETNRLFAANTLWVPVLWIPREDDPMAESVAGKLRDAGYRLCGPEKAVRTIQQVLDWLAAQRRDRFPLKVDCETGHPQWAQCYWVNLTRLDFGRRNDVLGSSRVPPGSGAVLALGPFAFDVTDPGPGVRIGWLPENYRGPLRLGDRIVAIAGKELPDARSYVEFMERQQEARSLAVIILRDGRRQRLETRIVLPKREEAQTARVQAEFLPETREILVVTRGVAELELYLPEGWAPARINWNGDDLGVAPAPGCWRLAAGTAPAACER